MQVIKIIVSVVSVCVANKQGIDFRTLNSNENHFHKIGEDIFDTAKNIFKVFNPNRNLTESPKLKMLITMHNDLHKITEQNYQLYDEIKNTSRVTTHNKNIIRLYDLNGLTAILYTIRLQKNKSQRIDTINETLKQNEDNISADINNKKGLIEFANSFVAKLRTLSVNDLFNVSNKSSDNKMLALKRKLKHWRPVELNEEQYPFNNSARRVYKGKTAKLDKYTFMASVHIGGKFVCSGSIISKRLIMTAASCLKSNDDIHHNTRKLTSVRIGSEYLKKGGFLIPIVQVYFHPLYNPTNLRNNLAIMEMKSTLYDPKEIKRIKLDRNQEINKIVANDKYKIVIVGWGATDESHTLAPNHQLASAKLDIYNLKECSNIYSRHYVTESHFCAGFTTKGGGACNVNINDFASKDVGGPGIIKGLLVGVISFGPAICGNPNEPTVFTRIGNYIVWISEMINQVERSAKSRQRNAEEWVISSKTTDATTKVLNMAKHLKIRQSGHRDKDTPTKDDAISIVKTIINEIIMTSKDQHDETLYKDLYDDFNQLYRQSISQNIGELDESYILSEGNTDGDSEYNDENEFITHSIPKRIGTAVTRSLIKVKMEPFVKTTRTFDKDQYARVNTTAISSALQNTESDSSTDVSYSHEVSDDYYDNNKGLSIDIPNTGIVT